jgi:hypothetical protein
MKHVGRFLLLFTLTCSFLWQEDKQFSIECPPDQYYASMRAIFYISGELPAPPRAICRFHIDGKESKKVYLDYTDDKGNQHRNEMFKLEKVLFEEKKP